MGASVLNRRLDEAGDGHDSLGDLVLTPREGEAKGRDVSEEADYKCVIDGKEADGETVAKEKEEVPMVSLGTYFKYADSTDKLLMLGGTLAGIASGVVQPVSIIFFGDMLNAFNEPGEITSEINRLAIIFSLLGAFSGLVGMLQVSCWITTAARQTEKIKNEYFKAILRQDIGWFDVSNPGELPAKISELTFSIQDGMGRKIGDGIMFISLFVAGFVVGFSEGWLLSLVLISTVPFLAATAYFMMLVVAESTKAGSSAYAKAGGVADEVLSAIRTVVSFNAQDKMANRFDSYLGEAEKVGIRKNMRLGFGTGLMFAVIFGTYALGMWFGARLVGETEDDCDSNCYDGGRVIIVFFSIIMGAMGIGQSAPSMQAVVSGRAAAYQVFGIIDRVPPIDVYSADGEELAHVDGRLEVKGVKFAYPSRPDTMIAKGYDLTVEAGQTVALVGPSGCGKSTLVNLIERFYDPQEGGIYLDGKELRSLNLSWLRSQIGLVGQEPVLFAATIAENIANGRQGVTEEEVMEAAKMANAYDFISTFPNGFATEVGEKGVQLSGGQKQRIAIARAIIRDPAILLLDEATSALDNESERIVQASLERLVQMRHRTTIIIAHRLSTIRDADKIAVIDNGKFVEEGSHDELMQIEHGLYKTLIEAQNKKSEKEKAREQQERAANPEGTGQGITVVEGGADGVGTPEKPRKDSNTNLQKTFSWISLKSAGGDKDEKEVVLSVPMSRLWKMSRSEWGYAGMGAIGSGVNGATFPIWGVLLTKFIVLFYKDLSFDELMDEAVKWSLLFIGLGLAFWAANCVQYWGFGVFAERLTRRLRLMSFKSMLRQEIAWFDKEENAPGALTSRLSSDATLVHAVTGEMTNRWVVALCTLSVGLIIAFANSWKLTLVMLCILPLLAFAGWVQMAAFVGDAGDGTSEPGGAGALVSESVGGIRTVAAFGLENKLHGIYVERLAGQTAEGKRKAIIAGVGFGLSQVIMFGSYGLVFWYGGDLVSSGELTFEQMNTVVMAIMMSSFGLGSAMQGMTDMKKAKEAVNNIFSVIDRVPAIDSSSVEGAKPQNVEGQIVFENVNFAYPERKDVQVMTNYSIKVKPGQTVALVGASGSGKSTSISLIERFYDPNSGVVKLDGHALTTLNVPWLRDQVGLVQQEPILFQGTIAENIGHGKANATLEEIKEAAKMANAANFISSFPDGYDTQVGDRGAQLSGGQKQRIAIARAIIKDPKVLLLDEATSALDTESERIVQESLDKLLQMQKRTTIIVAHRLTTIRNADKIVVINNGVAAEEGTHEELMKKEDGIYRLLYSKNMHE